MKNKTMPQKLATMKLVSEYSNKILEIIENKDAFTQSDLQGAVEAAVLGVITEVEATC